MQDQVHVIGRRKTAVARVFMRPGTGKVIVNGQDVKSYLKRAVLVITALEPMAATETKERFDIRAMVNGGGLTGQAGAIRLGIARALQVVMPELRSGLQKSGFLTRDAREKERKKYGQAGARKRFQFSKR
jgi:small subunit ribosomal protein S9